MINTSTSIDITSNSWRLTGWTPNLWRQRKSQEGDTQTLPEIGPLSIHLPCSVQQALLEAGHLPDWRIGFNARLCEWVENRHWIFSTSIELQHQERMCLRFERLDGQGVILWDGGECGFFDNSYIPLEFLLDESICTVGEHTLQVVFECSPRWLGQFGCTSAMTLGKPRWNYTWDWSPRLVELAIDGAVTLCSASRPSLALEQCETTDSTLKILIKKDSRLSLETPLFWSVSDENGVLASGETTYNDATTVGISREALHPRLWMPNGLGDAFLYNLDIKCADEKLHKRIGFRKFHLHSNPGAPNDANPWLFEVNGKAFFIQGINWTPILPNRADVTDEQYRRLIRLYREAGVNFFRVWGGADKEREIFYQLCDEAGILVWQEFPLSSSGIENLPPSDEKNLSMLEEIAQGYCDALLSHPSLVLWCGGNELFYKNNGSGVPCDGREPALKLLAEIVSQRTPGRPYLPTSASGKTEYCVVEENGEGKHHDVHGPWNYKGTFEDEWQPYWEQDDALFRSEFGCPGASDASLIRKYCANQNELLPINAQNPLWKHPLPWWLNDDVFRKENGRDAKSVEEFVQWSQERQSKSLSWAITCAKKRFPACGGVVIWMGHDSFPCFTNTSLIDFDMNPKSAYFAVKKCFTDSILDNVRNLVNDSKKF